MGVVARFLSTFGVALVLSPAAAASWQPHYPGPASDNATAYQLNVGHTGSITMSTGFSMPLKLLWSHAFASGFSGPSYPVIADGLVFVSAVTSSTTESVVAFRQDSGKVAWSRDVKPSVLAYDNGMLFVSTRAGAVTALNSLSGKQKWSVQLPYDDTSYGYPIAVSGMYYAGGGNDAFAAIYAVNESDGSLAWGLKGFPSQDAAPAYGPKGLYVAYPCLYVKLNPLKPKVDWYDQESCYGGGFVVPVYSGKRAYISDAARSNVVLNSKSGEEVDTFPGLGIPTLFADSSGKQYGVGLDENGLVCWSLATGTSAWTFVGDGHLATLPIAVNGQVVVGSSYGPLYVLDGKSGKLNWSINTGLYTETLAAGQGVLVAEGNNIVKVYAPQ
jgi:outer membrane protein assembly factor BamB